MKDKINSKHLNHKAFYIFLKLIFENNYFKYNKKFYKQIKGIAMGTKCGPSIANIYLHILETKFLFIHKPLFYSRYIDDIFIIVLNNFDILILKSFFHNLKLNIELDNAIVTFLDLSCYLNKNNPTVPKLKPFFFSQKLKKKQFFIFCHNLLPKSTREIKIFE